MSDHKFATRKEESDREFVVEPSQQDKIKQHVGGLLLRWLKYSASHEYDPEWSDDSEVRQLKAAYMHGYNDCRAEIMQKVINFVTGDFVVPDYDDDDDCC